MKAELPIKLGAPPPGLKELPQLQKSSSTTPPALSQNNSFTSIAKTLQHFMAAVKPSKTTPSSPPPQQFLKNFLGAHLIKLTPQQLQDKIDKKEPLPQNAIMIEENQSLPVIAMPLVLGDQTKWITIQYYEEGEKETCEKEKKHFAFQIHCDFNVLGPILIEGRIHAKHFALRLKTTEKIAATLKDGIQEIFEKNLDHYELKGELHFDQQPDIKPLYQMQQVIYA